MILLIPSRFPNWYPYAKSYCMVLVMMEKTPVSRNSVLEKIETQILPAWWLLISGTQVEVSGIPFPFCVFCFPWFFNPTSHTLCTASLNPERVRNTQHWWITCTFTGSQSKEKKMCFPTWSHLKGWNISRGAWLTHSSFQGASHAPAAIHEAPRAFPALCTITTCWIPAPELLPQAGKEKGPFQRPSLQSPVSTHSCTKNHSWSSWHWGCTTSWLEWKHRSSGYLTKKTEGFYFFPRKLKGLLHISIQAQRAPVFKQELFVCQEFQTFKIIKLL